MKTWKRCVAALLALIMMVTSTNFGFAAGTIDGETGIWSATAAEIVAEKYGFANDRRVTAIYANEAVNSGVEYTAEIPYANGTEGEQDLVVIDYLGKMIYARSFENNGLRWLPVEATLLVEGEVKEILPLIESVSYYNSEEFFAETAFTYEGKRYTVEVTYDLPVNIDLAEQQRLLDIPAHLMQAVKNIDTTLARMRSNLYLFGNEIPTLQKMLTMFLPATDDTPEEPFFDDEKHAAEINAIIALFSEYTKNKEEPQLDLLTLSYELWGGELSGLDYALGRGAEVQEKAAALYEKLLVLNESQRLRSLLSRVKEIDAEVHTSLKALYKYMGRLMAPLEELATDDSWQVLDESVQAGIFNAEYSPDALDELSATAGALSGYISPEANAETIVAAQAVVACEIITHDVTISVEAKVVGSGIGNSELAELDAHTATIRVLDGGTQQELDAAVRATGIEADAILNWNALSDAYKIGEANYLRTQTALDGVLTSDFNYIISYEPKYYTVSTNYGVTLNVPFGYLLDLPVCDDGEGWYDYRVIFESGGEVSYNQGSVFAVESDVEIIRTTGTAKFEYRVLDFLADDPQYGMNDLAKKILYNTALISPVVRIRIPGENISSVVDTGAGFYVKADSMASGMIGMTWNIDSATLYDGASIVKGNLPVVGGKISWDTAEFSHLIIDHSMKITRVRDGLISRELMEAEINRYANLPGTLSVEVGEQQRALNGEQGSSAKTMLARMEDYEWIFTYLKNADEKEIFEYMDTPDGKNAIRRLTGSESVNVKGVNGESLGYGGWSDYNTGSAALLYYLRQCESAGWSVATYYEYGYYADLEHQALLMADCLQDIVDDPGFIATAQFGGFSAQVESLKSVIPVLRTLSENMNPPNENLDVSHARFPTLIADLLEAEGKMDSYDNASTIYAYETVRRNGENFASLTVTVQKESVKRTATFDYEMKSEGSERYHVMTQGEVEALWQFVAEAEADLNLNEEEKRYHDCFTSGDFPVTSGRLKGSQEITMIYTPKSYTVTIDGVPTSEYMETLRYGDDPYTIDLPAMSSDKNSKYYYEYTLPGAASEGGDFVIGAQNGSVGHHTFSKDQLSELFPYGGYVIYRKSCLEKGIPTATLKVTLTAEWIRGVTDDKGNKFLFLDAVPTGLSYEEFVNQTELIDENGKTGVFELISLDGKVLEGDDLLETGTTIHHTMTNVYGQKLDSNSNGWVGYDGYTIIMMGDVNYDGKCDDADARAVAETYFLERDKEGNYIVPPELNFRLAANMNNNSTLDSNDAWFIRSKELHWGGEWNKHQIVYRTVLR